MFLRMGPRLALAVLCAAVLAVGAIEDVMSYKSLVLGSLASGQKASGRVSRSSCHNYFINVTAVGHNLVVDLDTSSTDLFLLVKASPILRHSLEEEHNYANYYQFKKQGDHHGVVVTSEHLSPGRWYIGVCNYVQEEALFANSRDAPSSGARNTAAIASRDPEYSVIATLKPAETSKAVAPAPAADDSEREEQTPCSRDNSCGTCSKSDPPTRAASADGKASPRAFRTVSQAGDDAPSRPPLPDPAIQVTFPPLPACPRPVRRRVSRPADPGCPPERLSSSQPRRTNCSKCHLPRPSSHVQSRHSGSGTSATAR
ncbi:hypothetical protein T484DRAFT_1744354 [Baffinella frigidus]|nr:hypothetical protein T484DRAFT_1744354 [Cryptophyta sp. CCMP2293]